MDFIGKPESGNNYNAYFGRRNSHNNPELVSMAVGDVLVWQRQYTNGGSPSSAAGKYQIIRGTLEGLRNAGKVAASDRFNQATQDHLAIELMKGRGLERFLADTLSTQDFALNLAMEWASMPVPRDVIRGNFQVRAGQSYYAGDGLNMALVTIPAFLAAIEAIRT